MARNKRNKPTGIIDKIFAPIQSQGGVGGRRNPNAASQLDEHGNPRVPTDLTPPPPKKRGR
jgi:hypothetical protein